MVAFSMRTFLVTKEDITIKTIKKQSHLTLDDRIEIQSCLDCGMTFKAIARRIGKCQTSISREVKRHITISRTSVVRSNNEPCKLLLKPPFVCNSCKRKRCACSFDKHLYYAKKAQEEYQALLSTSREGIPLNTEQFWEIDRIVAEGLKNGQHLYHIAKTNNLPTSIPTIYRHRQKGYLSASSTDFPRVVKFKQRKGNLVKYVPKGLKIDRAYMDFLAFREESDISTWVEMDTVIGRVGGKCILTFDFTFCNFMFGILLDNKSAAEVSSKVKQLKRRLIEHGTTFGMVFPLILTDNGGEFSDVFTLENDLNGSLETRLFFCDPLQSCQKPHVEKNHTLFRDIVPKGNSFDDFTQDTVNLIFSHINGIKRKRFCGKSPYDLFVFTFGESVTSAFGIVFIPPEQVIQSKKLLNP